MLRTRHIVFVSLFGLTAQGCAKRQEQEPASPESVAPTTPEQQPGYSQPPPADESAPTEKAPSSTDTPSGGEGAKGSTRADEQFSSLAEAEAALARAQAELGPPPAKSPEAKPTTAARPKKPAPGPAGGAPPSELAQGADRCVNACKAFASLKRAASAVCRLAGESNARCKRAQGIVQENEARVAVCKCAQNGD